MNFKIGEIYYNTRFFSFITYLGNGQFLSERGFNYPAPTKDLRIAKDYEIKNRISLMVKDSIKQNKLTLVDEEMESI